jgi:hypothetical protein
MKTAASAPVNTVTILTASEPARTKPAKAWDLTADQRPAAIARPAPAQDVVDAVGYARRHALRVAAHGTGWPIPDLTAGATKEVGKP